jgi:hypothetical protein
MLSLPFDVGGTLEAIAVAVFLLWVVWYFAGTAIVAHWPAAKSVSTAVDTSEQMAAYAALTAIRYVPQVAADPQAVTACEYLRTAVTVWKDAPTPEAKATT